MNISRIESWSRRLVVLATLAMPVILGCGGDDASEPTTPDPQVPVPVVIEVAEFGPMPIPADNPLTDLGIALGRRLFYDPILSGDNTQSCGSCHAQQFAFSDNGLQFSVGIEGDEGTRNAPTIINVGWAGPMFWDGRAPSVEAQALAPVPNPIEMNLAWDNAIERLSNHDEYPELFRVVFDTDTITSDHVVKAIAQFERTLVSHNSRFDQWRRGEAELTDAEQRGLDIFDTERADCFHCHGRPFFSDHLFHNNGLDDAPTDQGLAEITGNFEDLAKFKTPTLRNIEHTAPYMHDGRFQTLEECVQHYNSGGKFLVSVDPLMRVGMGLGLSDDEVADVVAFLKTLSDPDFLANPDFSDPFE